MAIRLGETFPDATLFESTEFGDACPLPPTKISVAEALKGKRIVIFGVPGAFTPTCSAKHIPGYIELLPQLRERGVDEVWCVSVNDGYVMAAWGRGANALGKIRMLGDGNVELTRKLGLEVDIPGMGQRMKRCSMLVENGVVKQLHVEAPGKFEVSDAATMLTHL